MQTNPDKIHEEVRAYYAAIASKSSCCSSSCDCGPQIYDQETLAGAPADAAGISLGCGNPTALSSLKPGETVLDLGSGGGLDCFLAARQVGPSGQVIGVDMTPEMLARATAAAEKMGLHNVSFRQGYIEQLPVEDASVDVILSNCVVNLSPDKRRVLSEMKRVLKPGGRIAITDVVTRGPLQPKFGEDIHSWSACVSGALPVESWAAGLLEEGFETISIRPALNDLPLEAMPSGVPFSAAIQAFIPGDMGSTGYFNQIAQQWDEMRQGFFSEAVREQAYAAAQVQADELAADIGAGTGFISEGLLQRGVRVIAVDQSPVMLAVLEEKLSSSGDLDCRPGSAEALPVESASVDAVFANMYLHHVEDPQAAIAEMARLLKPGGRLVITDLDEHDHDFLRTEQYDRWMGFKRRDVRQWLKKAGLVEVRSESIGSDCCAASKCGCSTASVGIFLGYGVKRE
jgi:ubiquinone/menaquinone biosynthesis C-methylase UbiE